MITKVGCRILVPKFVITEVGCSNSSPRMPSQWVLGPLGAQVLVAISSAGSLAKPLLAVAWGKRVVWAGGGWGGRQRAAGVQEVGQEEVQGSGQQWEQEQMQEDVHC